MNEPNPIRQLERDLLAYTADGYKRQLYMNHNEKTIPVGRVVLLPGGERIAVDFADGRDGTVISIKDKQKFWNDVVPTDRFVTATQFVDKSRGATSPHKSWYSKDGTWWVEGRLIRIPALNRVLNVDAIGDVRDAGQYLHISSFGEGYSSFHDIDFEEFIQAMHVAQQG